MKKTILLSAMAVVAAMTVSAKTADELRIYINPGHGGWTANDRPLPLVNHPDAFKREGTDTLSFFESNTDLEKSFGVLERLIEYGLPFDRTKNQTGVDHTTGAARDLEQNIVMSRVKNGPYKADNAAESQYPGGKPTDDYYWFNRNLSDIAEEVQVNNFDMFISIHSNANTDGDMVNYSLYLYRGYDDCRSGDGLDPALQQLDRKIAEKCWPYSIGVEHTAFSTKNQNIRGDVNFMGSGSYATRSDGSRVYGYYGVLKHTVPGFLVEGYFHTYQPSRHRVMNWDVCRVEGNAYARGIADHFGLTKESYGTVYGIVRDRHAKFSHQWYHPNPTSDDIYMPLNGATVKLMKGDEVIATKVTDGYYNGAFVFDKVEPGKYTVVVTHPDYKEVDNTIEVEVKAAADTYPKIFLESNAYEPPTEVAETYPDPASKVAGIQPANEYKFETEYTATIAELEGKIVRRTVVRKGMMYILAVDRLPEYAQVVETKPVPTVLVYDLENQKVVAEVSTEGTYGTIQDVADIQVTDDGYLIATCQTKNQYSDGERQDLPDGTKEPRGKMFVYKWANDENGLPTGKPEEWLNMTNAGRWYRAYAGGTFAWKGTVEDGIAFVTQPTITEPYYTLRSSSITVANGVQAGIADFLTPNNRCEVDGGANPGVGTGYRVIAAPYDLDKLLYIGPSNVFEYAYLPGDNASPTATGNAEIFAGMPGTVNMFRYAGASYMVAPDMEDGKNVGVKLIDVTGGLAKAEVVATVNTAMEGADVTSVSASGEVGTAYDKVNEVYTDAWLNLYVMRDNVITKLTTHNVAQPVYRAGIAYNLHNDKNEYGTTALAYSLSADVESAQIVMTSVANPETTYTFEVEATAGDHIVTPDVPEGEVYNWTLNTVTKSSPSAGEVFADNNGGLNVRGGVLPFNDPRYPTFGYTVVINGRNEGLDIYDPAGKKIASRKWKGATAWGGPTNTNVSDPIRGAEREGKAVLACYGDNAAGLSYVDIFSDEEPVVMYLGTRQKGGHYVYEGVNIGGGIADLCFVGEGEDTRLYTYSEDHDGQNGSGPTEYTFVRYDIGTGWQIATRPTVLGFTKNLVPAINRVDLIDCGNGFFYSQNRADGQNIEANPGFGYIACDGETEAATFNSSTLENIVSSCGAIAVTTDGKTLAHAQESHDIDIYDVEWNGNTPVITYSYTIPNPGYPTVTRTYMQMRFDAVGNLHTYVQEGDGYHVVATRGAGRQYSYDAPEAVLTGVDDIIVTEDKANDAQAVYYNLNGIRMAGDALTPGVYVKVAGGVATKVVVK